jgi:hypothetical protein
MIQELKVKIGEITEPQIFSPPRKLYTWSMQQGEVAYFRECDVVAILPPLPNHANVVCIADGKVWWAMHCGTIVKKE